MNEMSLGMLIVIVLLILILASLCVPQEKRFSSLGWMIGPGLLGFIVYKIGPMILVLLFLIVKWSIRWLASHILFVFAAILLAVIIFFGRLRWLDMKDNRAIRAGSIKAFDERVAHLQTFGYSRDKAMEAAIKIRDGKKK